MSRTIRMIGLDLDGTLLNSEKQLTAYTRDVLKKAIEQEVLWLPDVHFRECLMS